MVLRTPTRLSRHDGCYYEDLIYILQEMLGEHGCVDAYIESIKDYKEVLTDPNQFLSIAELRLGKGRPVKVWLFIMRK